MSPTAEERKAAIVENIARSAADRRKGARGEAAADFVREYYASVAPRDVLATSEQDLLGAALSLWGFGAERAPDTPKLRVFNPDPGEHGFASTHTVLEIVNDDMPFLVDSVTGELNRQGVAVHVAAHPIVEVARTGGGRRKSEGGPRRKLLAESYMHVEIDQQTDPERLAELEGAIAEVLSDVRVVVGDWSPMLDALRRVSRELDETDDAGEPRQVEEARAFLDWMGDNHFTFLGSRDYTLEKDGETMRAHPVPGTGLGLLRASTETDAPEPFPLSPEGMLDAGDDRRVVVSKAGRRSSVHRPVHMDYVGVRRFDGSGGVVGGTSFVGLFTSGVYYGSVRTIPLVRRKIDRIVHRAGFPAMSHDAKALLHILETFPRDELFQMSEDELYHTSLGILQLQDRQRFALFARKDASERFVSCLVYVPRDRYDTTLRLAMQEILEDAFGGEISAFYTQVTDSPLARAHFIVRTTPGEIPDFDVQRIEARLEAAARTWRDRLQETSVSELGEEAGLARAELYRDAFPGGYRESFDASEALADIEEVETVRADGAIRMHLYRDPHSPRHELRFKIFHGSPFRALSDVLPMLENMGLHVVSEVPYGVEPGKPRPNGHGGEPEEAGPPEEPELWIRDFELMTGDQEKVDLEAVRDSFQETFGRVWRGEMENDPFNTLVLACGLEWREVVVLRAYARYLRQVGIAFSQAYMARTLANNPRVTRLLVDYFEARFDPEGGDGDRGERGQKIRGRIRSALNSVAKLDEDRILRRFRNLVEATVRTNFYQPGEDGEPKGYVSFKLRSGKVSALPKPRPMYEIFVYSPATEAVHLRGGKVARGGIRWSDRREDFRTEVLGLMKAQMVKNAVIVPVGAKGGFIVKREDFADGEDRQAEAVRCYRTMIRGMLDVTDNLVGEEVVHPEAVVRHDEDDTYLVVAADKGTATFSDIANELSAEYDFWLGDAFASGGSVGYDHKRMGITARGAWESVKRHFRELGMDIQRQDFTAVGVGDMSGDVFGNGMLLSRHTRLVGAFNHQHIFVDPDPDPAASFAERERLFETPRSTWRDYDAEKISEGGGVFDRQAKSIKTTAAMRRRFGLTKATVNPNELIRALLTAPVDLLFFGGIGTYVKATFESHGQTGDRQNDDLRVEGRDLRCRVVGEGANLAVTQHGRIEFALGGGKINTDFIDNSGGVDTSDHEVNIKILTGEAELRGELDREARDRLLGGMTDEVAALVLRDNYLQSQAISVTEAEGTALLDQQQRLMRDLERAGRLDRSLEALPSDDALIDRRAEGRGLTRPELAVLLAYAKIFLEDELLASDLPEDPFLVHDLRLYFPRELAERFGSVLESHRLRREIIATHVTNSTVNRVGPTFVTRLAAETGRPPVDIARAYTICRDAFDLRSVWGAIESLDNRAPAELQIRMMREVGRLVERVTLWLLRKGERPLSIRRSVGSLRPAAETLREGLESILPKQNLALLRQKTARYVEEGVPRKVARRVAGLDFLTSACDIVGLAGHDGRSVEEVGRTYFEVGARFGLEWLRGATEALATDGIWVKAAADALIEDLFVHQGEITRHVLSTQPGSGEEALGRWIEERRPVVERMDSTLDELQGAPALELAMLAVANHQLRLLLGG